MSLSPDTRKETTTAFDEADFNARFACTLAKVEGDGDRPDFLLAPDEKRREHLRRASRRSLRMLEVAGTTFAAAGVAGYVLVATGVFAPGSPAEANEMPDSPSPNVSTRTFPVVDTNSAVELLGRNVTKLPGALSLPPNQVQDIAVGSDGNVLFVTESNMGSATPLAGQPSISFSMTHDTNPAPSIDLALNEKGSAWTATLQVAENVADYNDPASVISGMNSVFDQLGVCATLAFEDNGSVISGLEIKPSQDCGATAEPTK